MRAIKAWMGTPGGLIGVFGVMSLCAVGLGACVCAANGVPTASWVRNLAAWFVGAVVAIVLSRLRGQTVLSVALWLAPLGLLATLFNPDQEGVHRWIDLGPLHVNVAMIVLPAAVVALAIKAKQPVAWVAALGALLLLVAQPDASLATALALVIGLVALIAVRPIAARLPLIGAALVLAAVAWSRPDPLKAVAEVEEVIGLAFALSPFLAALAWLLLGLIAGAPVLATRSSEPDLRLAALALGLCLLAWAITPLLGAFPVPFVGIGMSPIVGAWLGVGLLASRLRAVR